jgi:hypothetical protein
VNTSGDNFAARFGGGLDFYVDPNIVITLDSSYVLPTGDAEDLDHVTISLGIQYRF